MLLLTYYSDPFNPELKPVSKVFQTSQISTVAYLRAQIKKNNANIMSVVLLDTTELGSEAVNWDVRAPNNALVYEINLFSGNNPIFTLVISCKIPSSMAGGNGFATSEVTDSIFLPNFD